MKFPSGKDLIKMIPLLVIALVIDNFKVVVLGLAVLTALFIFK